MDGTEITLLAEYSQRERDILLSGGILRQLREKEDKQPEVPPRVSGEAER
jgi:aconitate hydratase